MGSKMASTYDILMDVLKNDADSLSQQEIVEISREALKAQLGREFDSTRE
jgi:hypothetical protein